MLTLQHPHTTPAEQTEPPGSYLTTIALNPTHPQSGREQSDPCRMHARIIDATVAMREGPRTLWAQPTPGILVIRSTEPVTLGRLPRGYATGVTHHLWTPPPVGDVDAVIVGNPANRSDRIIDGRRVRVDTAISGYTQQIGWLRHLLDPLMRVDSVTIRHTWSQHGRHRTGNRVTHRLTVFRIAGHVDDPEPIRRLALAGIGRARAYGGGLSVWKPR